MRGVSVFLSFACVNVFVQRAAVHYCNCFPVQYLTIHDVPQKPTVVTAVCFNSTFVKPVIFSLHQALDLIIDRIVEGGNAIASVRLSARPFFSILSSEPADR